MLNQLPLAFKLLDNATFASFFKGGNNQQVLFGLQQFLKSNENNNDFSIKENFLYLWGKSGVGKTHLLQAMCNYALENNIQAMYISLEQIANLKFSTNDNQYDYLSGLETIELLCLDDLQFIINHVELQEKVLYLFNKIRTLGNKLIISANISPLYIPLNLLDLKSRMSWGVTYLLSELSDSEKISALMMRAKQIGLDLRLEVAKFLLARIPRSTKDLFATLEALDSATLAAKRKLTVPFVKDFLGV